MLKKIKCLLIILLIFLTWGCGKKTAPSLKSYEPPRPVESISAVRIEDDLLISWTYPNQDIKRIKNFIVTIQSDSNEETFVIPPDTFKYKYTKIKEGRVYQYHIKAMNQKGIEGPSTHNKAVICNLPNEKPEIRFQIKGDYLSINWGIPKLESQPEGCSQSLLYNVYRFEDIKSQSDTTINNSPIKENNITIPLEVNKITYYAVRPVIEGDTLNIGPMTEPIKISPDLLIPKTPKIHSINRNGNRVFIMWYEADESWVKGYRVYKRGDNDGDFKVIAEVLTPVFTEEIDEQRTYYYKISALGPVKESKASVTLEIK